MVFKSLKLIQMEYLGRGPAGWGGICLICVNLCFRLATHHIRGGGLFVWSYSARGQR